MQRRDDRKMVKIHSKTKQELIEYIDELEEIIYQITEPYTNIIDYNKIKLVKNIRERLK